MNLPSYAAAAARLLRLHALHTDSVAADRERGVSTIERALRARARRRRLQAALAVFAAAALLVLWQVARLTKLGSGAGFERVTISALPAGRGAALRVAGRELKLEGPAELGVGDSVETLTHGGAALRLSTGTQLELASAVTFRVDSQGPTERFALLRGQLSAQVAKLAKAQRFIVETPDAEIEVRGTKFRLSVLERGEACAGGSRTRLLVVEGLVEVRVAAGKLQVGAGRSWPSDCEMAAAEAPVAGPPQALAVERPAPPSEAVAQPMKTEPAHVASSTAAPERLAADAASALARQNDAFAASVALRRQGDVEGALRAYRDFSARFPNSPLAENAMVERMRLLAIHQPSSARAEAQRYLARYPRGFALDEARRLSGLP
jgi:ferric-dicitrate binding protein FerR (iron transport regulator)